MQGHRRLTTTELTERPGAWPTCCWTAASVCVGNARPSLPIDRARTSSPSTSSTAPSTWRPCSARTRRASAPFNVNYRYVADELAYLLTDAGAGASCTTPASPPRSRGARPACPPAAAPPPGRRRLGRRAPRPAPSTTRPALAAAPTRRRPTCRPTTSTSSTPAAPPACRRACCGGRPTSSSARHGRPAVGIGDVDVADALVEPPRAGAGHASCSPPRSCTAPRTGSR